MSNSVAASVTPRPVVQAIAAAAALSAVACLAVAAVGEALGAPSSLMQLKPAVFLPLVVVGVIAGTVGWNVNGKRSRSPRRLLQRLVPAVLVVSLIPDVLLGASGKPWSGIATLMTMHLVVAAVSLPIFARLLPLPRGEAD